MRYNWRTVLPAALIVAAASLYASDESNALEHRHIICAWCSATAKIVFTRSTMTVTRFSTGTVTTEKITRFGFSKEAVTVYWMRDKEETSADYSEFSADGRVMFLQPTDKVPHQEYRRC